MQYTENFSLRKPQYADPADVADLNYNFDEIDDILLYNRLISAEGYDITKTYNTGDLAVYENVLYKCLEDNVTGVWDSTKWTATNLANEIGNGGGASSLEDLTDVDITTPSDGQALIYDDTNDEWVNADLPDASVTKTVEGNPVEFSDGADAPLVKCVSEIQGSQDLHGYDKPWVGGAGVNKLDAAEDIVFTRTVEYNVAPIASGTTVYLHRDSFNYPEGEPETGAKYPYIIFLNSNNVSVGGVWLYSDSNVTLTGDATHVRIYSNGYNYDASDGVKVEIVGLVVSLSQVSTFSPYSNICPITSYDEGSVTVRGKNLVEETYENGNINTSGIVTSNEPNYDLQIAKVESGEKYTITSDELFVGAFYYNKPTAGSISYNGSRLADTPKTFTAPITGYVAFRTVHGYATPQCEEGQTATPYEPYTSTTSTATFGEDVYSGEVDYVNGSERCEMEVADLGDFTWTYVSRNNDNTGNIFYVQDARFKRNTDIICSICANKRVGTVWETLHLGEAGITISGGTPYLVVCLEYPDAASFTTAVTGQEIAYELATPTTSPVTPTNLPIKSLSGYNHIESSTGDLEVEYITKGMQPILDLIDDGNYSETTLWSGTQASSSGGELISLADNISDYDAIVIDCGRMGEGTSDYRHGYLWYLTSNISVGQWFLQIINNNDNCNAYWEYTSDSSITWQSAYGAYPVTLFSVKGLKFGGGSSSAHVYSTDEQIVGTWIDGSAIFEKTFEFSTAVAISPNDWATTSISNAGIDKCIECFGISPSGAAWSFLGATGDTGNYINILNPRYTSIDVKWFTLRYTKSSNRSLNLSRGEISEGNRKAVETPIEEEKAEENDLDEWLEDSEEIEEEVDEGTDEDSEEPEEEER